MLMRSRTIGFATLAVFVLFGAVACGDDGTGPGDGGDPAGLSLSQETVAFHAIGDVVTLTATVTDGAGDPITDATVEWSSSDPTVAEATDGQVASVGVGSADITASSGPVSATASVTVEQVPATVTVSPAADTLAEGETVQLSVTVADSNDVVIPDAEVGWSSSDDGAAAVDGSGLVSGVRGGFTAVITADAGGVSGTTAVRVLGRILFQTMSADGDYEIYVMNADGTGLANRTNHPAHELSPSWSPDGEKFAFDSDRDGDPDVYVASRDGVTVTQMNDVAGSDWDFVWPPMDLLGSRDPLFVSTRDGDPDIYSMQMGSGGTSAGATQLTLNSAADYQPTWSPDGSLILFFSNRDGDHEIYIMTPDGSSGGRLTNNTDFDGYPRWSPDGSKIVFTSDRAGNREIYVMNADGSGLTRLTNDPAQDGAASWSPDGTRIAFRSERDPGDGTTDGEIWIMDADGGNLVQVTDDTRSQTAPVWRPRP